MLSSVCGYIRHRQQKYTIRGEAWIFQDVIDHNLGYIYDDGAQSRTFSDAGTFVECIMRMIEDYATFNKVGNIINIGAEQAIQIGELAQIVLEETGRAVPIQRFPYHSVFPNRRDVRWRAPNTERLYEAIGTVAWPNIREIVRAVSIDISNDISASTFLAEMNHDETGSLFTYTGKCIFL